MSINITCLRRPAARRLLLGSLALGAAATVAACSSSSPSTAAGSPGRATASASSAAAVTISAKSVPGVGTILVNGQGQTLYLLTSEQGGKITCTDDNGCTKPWPDQELPKGDTAGKATGGANPALLGTIKSDDGDVYVTYGGWPLYTFAGDGGPGKANGEGITSFGGTWYVINAAGKPVMSATSSGSSSTSTTSGY